MEFLITTDRDQVSIDKKIVMVDGTVPGWDPKPGDWHYDHHRLGGALCQLDELPLSNIPVNEGIFDNSQFVSTMLDADAIVAAAALILVADGYNVPLLWRAIALDCDHLTCNIPAANEIFPLEVAQEARDIVAGLKKMGDKIQKELKLPDDRRQWPKQDKQRFDSLCFKRGVQLLISCATTGSYAAIKKLAASYWKYQHELRATIATEQRVISDDNFYYFDFRGWDKGYVDPRMPLDLVQNKVKFPVTITVRDVIVEGKFLGISYTVGSDCRHPSYGKYDFCKSNLWSALTDAEQIKNPRWGVDKSTGKTHGWGGRATVGGSSWNFPSGLEPDEVAKVILKTIK